MGAPRSRRPTEKTRLVVEKCTLPLVVDLLGFSVDAETSFVMFNRNLRQIYERPRAKGSGTSRARIARVANWRRERNSSVPWTSPQLAETQNNGSVSEHFFLFQDQIAAEKLRFRSIHLIDLTDLIAEKGPVNYLGDEPASGAP